MIKATLRTGLSSPSWRLTLDLNPARYSETMSGQIVELSNANNGVEPGRIYSIVNLRTGTLMSWSKDEADGSPAQGKCCRNPSKTYTKLKVAFQQTH